MKQLTDAELRVLGAYNEPRRESGYMMIGDTRVNGTIEIQQKQDRDPESVVDAIRPVVNRIALTVVMRQNNP